MKTLQLLFTILISFAFLSTGIGQTAIYQENFNDSASVVTSWQNGTMDEWDWRDDGIADGGNYWDNRSRIISPSLGGAIVFNSDLLADNGVMAPHQIELISPQIGFSGTVDPIYMEFYQYYRNFNSQTRVEYSTDGGNTYNVLANINGDYSQNIEGPRLDRVLLDASVLAGEPSVLIKFIFFGDHYFWIIDDLTFYEGLPILETMPDSLGITLNFTGQPYLVDSLGGAFNPEQLIVKFDPAATPAQKQDIRDEFSVYDVQYCDCDSLELWFINGPSDNGGNTLGPTGGTIGVMANKDQAKSKSEVDDVDLNHYAFSQFQLLGPPCGTFSSKLYSHIDYLKDSFPDENPDATVIAILDTGIDYYHTDLNDFIWRSPEPPVNDNIDDGANCYFDDFFGWNFVCDNNNPYDDHSHGTHVAGIIVDSLKGNYPSCDFRIMPIKTHDQNGIAELFDVICGTYYAYKNGAQVINDSWGWYGIESTILKGAIEDAGDAGTLVVAAAGNDTYDITSDRQYPATHGESNIITVGAINSFVSPQIADFSNFSASEVDIAAPGTMILSSVPNFSPFVTHNLQGTKSGTSMATPMVAAAAAIAYCSGKTEPSSVKYNVLYCADKYSSLEPFIAEGRVLQYLFPCLVPTEELPQFLSYELSLFPNPTQDLIWVQVQESIFEPATIEVLNSLGQSLWIEQIDQLLANQPLAVDLSNFQSGMYFIRVQIGAQMWVGQGVKVE